MAAFLGNLRNVVITSFVLAILLVGVYCATQGFDGIAFELFVLRWLHVVAGVMWIGLLWYFNFVQIPTMPKVPDEFKKGVSGYIAPAALFWFRWAAVFTVLMGLILAWLRGYLVQALTLGLTETPMGVGHSFIGLGMWLGLIMAFNVWVFIWPAQKIALGIVDGDADAKAAAGRRGMIFSRLNTFLSVPMLACMTMNQTIFG